MPRLPRVHIEKALYLVTAKGINHLNLFNDLSDYENYLELLMKYKKEHQFKLFAFVLLPTHLYLLIEPHSEATISIIMHNLHSSYTKIYNSRYNREGHVFQGRFKAIIAEKDTYLKDLVSYIHLYAQKAGSASDMTGYPHCSYTLYVKHPLDAEDGKLPDMRDEIREVLKSLPQEVRTGSPDTAMRLMTLDRFEGFNKLLQRRYFLGSEGFIADVRKKIEEASLENKKETVIIRRPNRIFIAAGSAAIFVLTIVAGNLYASNKGLRNTVALTHEEFAERIRVLEELIAKSTAPEIKGEGVDNTSWEITLLPVGWKDDEKPRNDRLSIDNGRVFSEYLSGGDFSFVSLKQEHMDSRGQAGP